MTEYCSPAVHVYYVLLAWSTDTFSLNLQDIISADDTRDFSHLHELSGKFKLYFDVIYR